MKPESPTAGQPTARDLVAMAEFQPMFVLSETQYQDVINRLTGLLQDTIEYMRDTDQADQSTTLAFQARDVLQFYDDDVADLITFAARTGDNEKGLGQAREEALW